MSVAADDVDLLASRKLAPDAVINENDRGEAASYNSLVWQKQETVGYMPSAREGHSSISRGDNVYIFGGIEAAVRVNSTIKLSMSSKEWTIENCFGDEIPSGRAFHASCALDKYMLIFGGESMIQERANVKVPFDSEYRVQTNHPLSRQSSFVVNLEGKSIAGLGQTDSIARKSSYNSINLEDDFAGTIRSYPCLDDFYALDLENNIWLKIRCNLAPLPRKGHSMVIAPVHLGNETRECVILFGGYSKEKNTLSNTVHICPTSEILTSLQQLTEAFASGRTLPEYEACVNWRVLKTKGRAPPARYRHAASLVSGNYGNDQMVITGGIIQTDEVPVASNDVYSLDLFSLSWTRLFDGSRVIPDDLTPPPLYGHVSCSIIGSINNDEDDDAIIPELFNSTNSDKMNVIIYGGCRSMSRATAACIRHVYSFDMINRTWRKINTGYVFPPERFSHAVAVVQGWAPSYEFPLPNNYDSNEAISHALNVSAVPVSNTPLGGTAGINSGMFGQAAQPVDTTIEKSLTKPTDTYGRSGVKPVIRSPSRSPSRQHHHRGSHLYESNDAKMLRSSFSPSKRISPRKVGNAQENATATTSPGNANFGAGQGQKFAPSASRQPICAVIFGGVSQTICSPDTWCLDLRWRSAGVAQFDQSIRNRLSNYIHDHLGGTNPVPNMKQINEHDDIENEDEQHNIYESAPNSPRQPRTPRNSEDKDEEDTEGNRGSFVAPLPGHLHKQGSSGHLGQGRLKRDDTLDSIPEVTPNESENNSVSQYVDDVDLGITTPARKNSSTECPPGTPNLLLRPRAIPEHLQAMKRLQKSSSAASFLPVNSLRSRPPSYRGSHAPSNTASRRNSLKSLDSHDSGRGSEYLKSPEKKNVHRTPSFLSQSAPGPLSTLDKMTDEVGEAFLKVKKEKAVADMYGLAEKERAEKAEDQIQQLLAELAEVRSHLDNTVNMNAVHVAELEKALEESRERERRLKLLNEEAYQLLLLKGISR
jgi:hypothetical protein